jgi:hypothetical protein
MNSSPIHWAFALSQEIHFLAVSVELFQGTALALEPISLDNLRSTN